MDFDPRDYDSRDDERRDTRDHRRELGRGSGAHLRQSDSHKQLHDSREGSRWPVRLFPDDVAVGIDETGSPHLLHLMTTPLDDDFRAVLQRYGDLLGALPRWTFRLLVPAAMAPLLGRFQVTFRDELATPLSATTVDELR